MQRTADAATLAASLLAVSSGVHPYNLDRLLPGHTASHTSASGLRAEEEEAALAAQALAAPHVASLTSALEPRADEGEAALAALPRRGTLASKAPWMRST